MITQTVDFEQLSLPFKKENLVSYCFPPGPETLFFFKWDRHWELHRDAQECIKQEMV